MTTPSIPQKQCTKCKRLLPATHEYFTYDKTKKDGWYSCCRKCYKIRTREVLPDGFSRCAKCKQLLPATREHFSPCKKKKNNMSSYCKPCMAARVMQDYIPTPLVLKTKEELKERKRKNDKEYGEKNKERFKAYQKEYYSQNAEVLIQKSKEWAEKNPEKVKINNKVRKARRRSLEYNAEGDHTNEDIQKQYQSQNGLCWWCGKKLNGNFHADHLTPLARGGTNWQRNGQVNYFESRYIFGEWDM